MLLLVGLALAQEPPPAHRVFYLFESGRPEQALEEAAAALAADPLDPAVHRAYVYAASQGLRESAAMERVYRDWLTEEPDAEVAGVALANLLTWTHDEPGPWCDEAAALTAKPSPRPEVEALRLRARLEARRSCFFEDGGEREALFAMGPGPARPYALRLRVSDGVDEALRADLAALYRDEPWNLDYVDGLWRDAAEGEALEGARADALAAARSRADSDDPLVLEAVAWVLRRGGEPAEGDAALERLSHVDPGRGPTQRSGYDAVSWVSRTPTAWSEVHRDLQDAAWSEPRWRAAARLAALEPGDDDPDLAAFYDALYAEATHDSWPARAQRARLDAVASNPDDYELVEELAFHAGQPFGDPALTLAALDHLLDGSWTYDPRGEHWAEGYADWREQAACRRATLLAHRGWLVHQAGRTAEALPDLELAALLCDDGLVQRRLGLVLAALDRPEEALRHLTLGLAAEHLPYDLQVRAARREAARLYEGRRWSRRGLDGWIAANSPSQAVLRPGAEDDDGTAGGRLGRAFPDLTVQEGDASLQLSSIPGLRVVDVWATWCGPCVSSLPELDALAERYGPRGVTVLALSVDDDREDLETFKQRPRRPDYREVWAGPDAMDALKISGIPAVYLVGADGEVLYYHLGSGGYAELEAELEALLDAGG